MTRRPLNTIWHCWSCREKCLTTSTSEVPVYQEGQRRHQPGVSVWLLAGERRMKLTSSAPMSSTMPGCPLLPDQHVNAHTLNSPSARTKSVLATLRDPPIHAQATQEDHWCVRTSTRCGQCMGSLPSVKAAASMASTVSTPRWPTTFPGSSKSSLITKAAHSKLYSLALNQLGGKMVV